MRAAHLRSVLTAAALCAPWMFAACTSGGGDGSTPPSGQPPVTSWPMSPQPPTEPQTEPPAISGGTLLVLNDGHTAAAADSDQDVVWFVDTTAQAVVGSAALQPGDEPGRVVEDSAGRVHVVLRGGGAIATIDPSSGKVTRRAVCPAPRGIAYDAAADALHVACADGLLTTFPAAGGAATASVTLDRDLRDVVLLDGTRYVSTFRSAQLLQVAADGTISQRFTMASAQAPDVEAGVVNAVPSVAYRTVALPGGGGLAMVHQRALDAVISTMPGGYSSGGCPGVGIVQDTVSVITPGLPIATPPSLMMTTLAVDLAVSPDGSTVALAVAGNMGPGVVTYPLAIFQTSDAPCAPPPGGTSVVSGQAVAVAYDGQGQLIAQLRSPAMILVGNNGTIDLPSTAMLSEGHSIFHTATKGAIACASCHPEGGDDGRVWQFAGIGPRRTQNIRGGVLARAPFHWSGDIADMDTLVSVVFEGRMTGPTLSEPQITDLGQWMDAQHALLPPTPADPAAVSRGSQTFNDPAVGCTACHSGPQLSNHSLVDVGTGGMFKVPSLVAVGYRAPYLHDGCATTLLDRFTPSCGGGDQHGTTSQLTPAQLSDLVAYLESL